MVLGGDHLVELADEGIGAGHQVALDVHFLFFGAHGVVVLRGRRRERLGRALRLPEEGHGAVGHVVAGGVVVCGVGWEGVSVRGGAFAWALA